MADFFGEVAVHEVVHEPHGDFGDAGGPFVNFDAVELVDVHAGEVGNVHDALGIAVEGGEDVVFDGADFAVGNDEEVAAAAGGVEEGQAGQFVVQALEGGAVGAGFGALGLEVIEKEGANDFENVGFGGVVSADLPAGARLHDALKKRAEHGGGDARPVEPGGGQQRVAHGAVEVCQRQRIGKQAAVDVRQAGEGFIQRALAVLNRRVEGVEKFGDGGAEAFAVGGGFLNQEVKGAVVEQAGVVGEQAKEQADQKQLAVVVGIAGVFESVGQPRHQVGGLDVHRGFGGEGVLLIAGNEGEVLDVTVEFRERKVRNQIAVLVEVIEQQPGEVSDDDIFGGFVVAAFADEVLHIIEGLQLGFFQVFAGGFMLGQQPSLPEQVNAVIGALERADRFLEAGHGAAVEAKDVEKSVPEGFGFGGLAGFIGPFAGKGHRTRLDFIPA
ncbi:MAG: hypothetical protein BWX54_00677 [Verrucomicrobia bacterium ADurb.Bin018]|nr:MAG: hypothetical protein BWX54_00677 [Verrucomicrobia bacterium ADurb.Bin018]